MNETGRSDLDLWEDELQTGWPHRLPGHKRQPCLITGLIIIAISIGLWAILAAIGWLAWDLARHWP